MAKVGPATEKVLARFYVGTCARMKEVLKVGESQPEFIRRAVDRELQYRLEEPLAEMVDSGPLSSFFRTGTFSDSD